MRVLLNNSKRFNPRFSESCKRNHRICESRVFKESENREGTILFIINAEWDWQQGSFSDSAFSFDDYILFNNNYGLAEQIDRKMYEMIDEDPTSQDLADYVDANLKGKVTKIDLNWNDRTDQLKVLVHLAPGVDAAAIKDEVWDYIEGQMSDGWGEGFEQQEIASETVYSVYNENCEYDNDVFYDDSEAEEDCRRKNDDIEQSNDNLDDDEEPSDDHYEVATVDLTLYCHFWSPKGKLLSKTYINGVDENGFDPDGYKNGRDSSGYDRDGFDKDGFNRNGRDKDGFDREGFNRDGKDRDGFDRNGEKDLTDNRPANSKGKKNGALFTQKKDGTVRIRNTFDMGESRKRDSRKLQEAVKLPAGFESYCPVEEIDPRILILCKYLAKFRLGGSVDKDKVYVYFGKLSWLKYEPRRGRLEDRLFPVLEAAGVDPNDYKVVEDFDHGECYYSISLANGLKEEIIGKGKYGIEVKDPRGLWVPASENYPRNGEPVEFKKEDDAKNSDVYKRLVDRYGKDKVRTYKQDKPKN